jgi:transposase-like protein
MTKQNDNKKEIQKIINNQELKKSQKMIQLYQLGLTVKEISVEMNILYNFVYNVVSNYCNINKVELTTSKSENKKDKIIELYLQNKSNKEISIELSTNYNYVFNTLKKYKESIATKESNVE